MRGFAVNHVVATGNRTPSAGDKVIIDAWIAGQARNDSCGQGGHCVDSAKPADIADIGRTEP